MGVFIGCMLYIALCTWFWAPGIAILALIPVGLIGISALLFLPFSKLLSLEGNPAYPYEDKMPKVRKTRKTKAAI